MGPNLNQQLHAMERDGHIMLPGIFDPHTVAAIAEDLDHALRADETHQSAIARDQTGFASASFSSSVTTI